MLRSTFTAFYRSFTRHPLYSILNLLGLSFGIAVFITLGLFFRFETTFEKWLPHADRIYMVQDSWTLSSVTTEPQPWTAGVVLEDLKADYPQTIGTRIWESNVTVHMGAQTTRESVILVDPDFFKVFDLVMMQGDKATALSSPDYVMVSQTMADKYFPGGKAMGKTIRLTDEQGTHDYRVSAVLKNLPFNTESKFDFVRLITSQYTSTVGGWKHYGSQRLQTALLLPGPERAAELNRGFLQFVDRHAAGNFGQDVPHTLLKVTVAPLVSLHLADEKTRTSVYVLGVVGILAFLIAAINYINLATARAGMRAKEVAVRKTLGATQSSLRTQFLCEALLTTVIAALIGLSLVEVGLPQINAFGNLHLKLDYSDEAIPLAIAGAFIVVVGLLAGLYPAFVLAGFKPAQVLASSRSPAGGRLAIRIREALVVVQFGVVVAFFIMVAGFLSQLEHMKTANVGFKRAGLMITDSTYDPAISDSQRTAIWAAFRAIPGVLSVTAGNGAPGDNSLTNNTTVLPPGYTGRAMSISWVITGPEFFTTYKANLAAGRYFDPSRGDDHYYNLVDGKRIMAADGTVTNVVINRTALKLLNFKSADAALGQVVTFDDRKSRIVGVIEDMRFRSPKDPVPPTMYVYYDTPHDHTVTGLRYSGVSEPVMRARMQQAWRIIAPEVPFKVVSAEENIDEYYKPDRNRSNLFSVGAGVAALIGCIGLYGMAAFNTSRRAREVGLRKVLGASSGKVVGLLIGQFLRPVLLANLIAWPVAWYALTQWLSQFDDAVELNPLIFVAASAIALVIALGTVGGLALATARTEPGKALRHE